MENMSIKKNIRHSTFPSNNVIVISNSNIRHYLYVKYYSAKSNITIIFTMSLPTKALENFIAWEGKTSIGVIEINQFGEVLQLKDLHNCDIQTAYLHWKYQTGNSNHLAQQNQIEKPSGKDKIYLYLFTKYVI